MIRLRHVATLAIAASGLALSGPHRASQTRERSAFLRTTNDVHMDAGCRVRGVWELVSVSQNGKDQPLAGYRGMKVLTDQHFMFVGQAAKRDTLPLTTEMDTLRAYQLSGGAGTYTTTGTTYIEHIDIFVIPSWIGTSFRARCRIEGRLWYHSFTDPNDTTAGPGPYQHFIEVWRRLE
jgi:hypothetical protein